MTNNCWFIEQRTARKVQQMAFIAPQEIQVVVSAQNPSCNLRQRSSRRKGANKAQKVARIYSRIIGNFQTGQNDLKAQKVASTYSRIIDNFHTSQNISKAQVVQKVIQVANMYSRILDNFSMRQNNLKAQVVQHAALVALHETQLEFWFKILSIISEDPVDKR